MSVTGAENRNRYFRSLDELQQTPEFEQFLTREFPQAASEFPEGVSRRRWLQLMSASLALGGLSGCRYNREEVASFVVRPEGRVPGVPEHFATNFEWAGRAIHALVTNIDGRPIKVDGNGQHPAYANSQPVDFAKNDKLISAGSDVFTQASILSLYDQDRISLVLKRSKAGETIKNSSTDDDESQAKSWAAFNNYVSDTIGEIGDGASLAILFEPSRSPSIQRMYGEIHKKYPAATFVRYESVYSGNVGKAIDAVGAGKSTLLFNLESAKVIVSLDADLFGSDPNAVHYARQYSIHRSPKGEWMNRLYSIESQYSVTGTAADFRLALQSSQMGVLLDKIEKAILEGKVTEDAAPDKGYETLPEGEKVDRLVTSIASDLLVNNKGMSVLAVGSHHSLAIQVACLRINAMLGNLGKTVNLVEIPNEAGDLPSIKLDDFVNEASKFKKLWITAPNPVFSAAGDVKLADAIKQIGDVVYLSHYDDETARNCRWTVPAAHPLEAWGDVRSAEGVYSIGQPTIDALLGGKSVAEFLSILSGLEVTDGQAIVKATAEKIAGGQLSDRKWKEALHVGFLSGTEGKKFNGDIKADVKELKANDLRSRTYELPSGEVRLAFEPHRIEVVVLPSDTIYDGRLGNNGWLQELPQPITKLVWDNAAICSPSTAKTLGAKQGELITLTLGESKVSLPVFLVPGQAEGSFTVNLGYGRAKELGGSIAGAVGTNLAPFRRWNQAAIYTGITASATSIPYKLATTQDHFSLDTLGQSEVAKRAPQIIREGTLDEYKQNADFTHNIVEHHFENVNLWKESPSVEQNHKWGMTIDLNKCTGCNACVIACQSENNVPIVGKEQVSRSREMHWLRIDRYFQADVDSEKSAAQVREGKPLDTKVVMQPMACAHCETAPCEEVCPVAATVHTEEGINAMAYNRCIGTRYCGNNCPYKVRRFNYFNYNKEYGYFYGWQDLREKASKKLQSLVLNPEVTVRGRGVMEKCTYCIQRIQNAKIVTRTRGDGRIHDGDVKTACQEACPTQAIIFGDLHDKSSRVSISRDERKYEVLEELNIRARTLYLSRIRNLPKRLQTTSQLNPHRPGGNHHEEHSQTEGDHGHHS